METTKHYLMMKFGEYYAKNKIKPPKDFRSREFAFLFFDSDSMYRHISFNSEEELSSYLASSKPTHVYYSSAYYLYPDKEKMEEKGWISADLIFDIDADHLPVKASFEKSLEIAKKEVEKLTKILKLDFGVKDFEVYFSGGRGYHVHVFDEELRGLGSAERKEIVDYLTVNEPDLNAGSRVMLRVKNYLKKRGLRITKENIAKILQKIKVHIDAPVSADVKRLIRMPESLHGKTGLRVTKVEDLKSFDPLRDAVVFGDEKIRVKILTNAKLRMRGEFFELYSGEAKLPEFLAIFLLCRGMATI